MKTILFTISILFISLSAKATEENDKRITRTEYIDAWKDVAIRNMMEYKIPASITLAQAILESGDGNSELAKMSNNHFGIKCHDWTGERVYYDDDAKGECFRKYDDAGASFADHCKFLMRKRYAPLFELKPTDYKSWARGLKKCGYATNPSYAKLLIGIIEKYDLSKYDKQTVKFDKEVLVDETGNKDSDQKETANGEVKSEAKGTSIPSSITLVSTRQIATSANRIKFILAREGDSIDKIAEELDMAPWQIRKYNDLAKSASLSSGDKIYIQPKRTKAKEEWHVVKDGETMRSISQLHGIRMRSLYKKNKLVAGTQPKVGTKLSLRTSVK